MQWLKLIRFGPLGSSIPPISFIGTKQIVTKGILINTTRMNPSIIMGIKPTESKGIPPVKIHANNHSAMLFGSIFCASNDFIIINDF